MLIRGGGAAGRRLRAVGGALGRGGGRSAWPPSTAASRWATWAWSRRSRRPPRSCPLVVGIAGGDRPGGAPVRRARAGARGRGARLARGGGGRPGGGTARGAGLAMLSALGFGLFFVGMDNASDADVGWAMLVNRITSVSLLLAAFAVLRPPLAARAGRRPGAGDWSGRSTSRANAMFALASTEGLVSLVSVLGSLYPLTTVALAAVVLGERPHRVAQVGVVTALAGVVLIAGGLKRGRRLPSLEMSLPWAEPFAAALALRHEPGLVLLESMPGFGDARAPLVPRGAARRGRDRRDRAPSTGSATAGGPAGSPTTSGARSSGCPAAAATTSACRRWRSGRFEAWLEFDHARRTVARPRRRATPRTCCARCARAGAGRPPRTSRSPAGDSSLPRPGLRAGGAARDRLHPRRRRVPGQPLAAPQRASGAATRSRSTRRLRATSPAPFVALVRLGGADVISASPERFLQPPRRARSRRGRSRARARAARSGRGPAPGARAALERQGPSPRT